MVTPEDEMLMLLKEAIASGELTIEPSETIYACFDLLRGQFPFSGTQISWKGVPSHIERLAGEKFWDSTGCSFHVVREAPLIDSFFETSIEASSAKPSDLLLVFGDGEPDLVFKGSIPTIKNNLLHFLSMPHHTYICPEDFRWCICYSLEGYMDFGVAPENPCQ